MTSSTIAPWRRSPRINRINSLQPSRNGPSCAAPWPKAAKTSCPQGRARRAVGRVLPRVPVVLPLADLGAPERRRRAGLPRGRGRGSGGGAFPVTVLARAVEARPLKSLEEARRGPAFHGPHGRLPRKEVELPSGPAPFPRPLAGLPPFRAGLGAGGSPLRGCVSWTDLASLSSTEGFAPVLAEGESRRREEALLSLLARVPERYRLRVEVFHG